MKGRDVEWGKAWNGNRRIFRELYFAQAATEGLLFPTSFICHATGSKPQEACSTVAPDLSPDWTDQIIHKPIVLSQFKDQLGTGTHSIKCTCL